MPINYQNGKIYKIVSNIDDDICYVGSTTRPLLCQRMVEHRSKYKRWTDGKSNFVTSFEMFEKYGVEGCRIELLEIFPCNSKDELSKKEGDYIRSLECVNKVIPNRTKKEYREINRDTIAEKHKEYYDANRNTILEKVKEYYDANRDTILEKAKEYREINRDTILEKHKEYYEANKAIIAEKRSVKYTCVCGCILSKNDKSRHEKSQKHMNYISSNTI